MVLAVCSVALLGFLSREAETASPPRRIAIALPEGWQVAGLERWASFARRQGIEIRIAGEAEPSSPGREVVRISAPPVSEAFRRRLAPFSVTLEAAGFVFDGRAYRAAGDAVVLSDPDRLSETIILGNSREAAMRIARWIFRGEDRAPGAFRAVSGELTKEGRFRRGRGGALEIDRDSERDRIVDRERFFSSLASAGRGTTVWRFRETERRSFERWSCVLDRFLSGARRGISITVFLFPDPATKGLYVGSSRPADLSWEGGRARIDVDASAPAEPDLVSPVLAAAAIGGSELGLRQRPTLLLAAGARAHGRWWGRDVASFASFLEGAGAHPTAEEVLSRDERDDLSPVCAIGAAASWLEAGFREGGDPALRRVFASSSRELSATLERWRRTAMTKVVAPPPRRPLPAGFLRGVSYTMANSIEGSYSSPRSLETLKRLAAMAVNSVSVIPYGFSRTAREAEIGFVHRSPRGETDEGTVRAVSDARSLGMTAMVKPQIWIGSGEFVGTVAMEKPADWAGWFDAYRRFIVHHAIVAEASGAALFCVGTELAGTESREKEWREVIRAVRLATGAPLVYATNWAAGAARVRFWDALDAIGADFYDPLSADAGASDAALVEGARRAAQPVARLSVEMRRPVIFAEAGYPPARGAWTAPHDEDSSRPLDPGDAARAVRAVFAALGGEKWWKGVYWWKAFSDGRDAASSDRGFNFLGRPAAEAIASGFRKLASDESGSR